MRRYSIPAVFVVLFFLGVFCDPAFAGKAEFHGGFYASYEYTDNYRGTAHNERSDSIYEIGPSAEMLYRSGTASFGVSGYAARSFHNRFDDDDATEVDLGSTLSLAGQRDSAELEYAFLQTSRRDRLDEAIGTSRTHRAGLNLSRALTQSLNAGLGCSYLTESNPWPDEDLVSRGVSGNLAYRFSPRTVTRMRVEYDTYDYEVSEDVQVIRSALGIETYVTRRASLGLDGDYEHQVRDILPESDIYNILLSWGYFFTPGTRMVLSGGCSLLSVEGRDRESAFAARGEITSQTRNDVFSLSVSREYRAEFTRDRYGTYDARNAYLSWERTLLRNLSLVSSITYEDRKPVSHEDELTLDRQEEKDFGGSLALNWTPLRYMVVRTSYAYLRETGEDMDTQTENRYRIITEVRY